MQIIASDLVRIQDDADYYCDFFKRYSVDLLWEARLQPVLSKPRLIEAHGAWVDDMKRLQDREPRLKDGLDHFKRSGNLGFWLRRMGPIVETADLSGAIHEVEQHPLPQDAKDLRELLFGYANEYVAFDIGFQFCKFYEADSPRAESLQLDQGYIKMVCHFMKYKNLSPHALTVIYRSLFMR